MSRFTAAIFVLALLELTGCKAIQSPASIAAARAPVEVSDPNDWRLIASDADAASIGRIADSWESALAHVRARGDSKALASEGALIDPKAALPRPVPPPGVYHCRVVRLGLVKMQQGRAWAAFKPFYCFIAVEGALLTFTKATGTHRPGGRLWDDGDTRMVFLGAAAMRADGPLPAYGDNPASNQVGVVERIGDFRWRMVLPRSTPEALLDVIELLPDAPAQGQQLKPSSRRAS